MTLTPLGAPGRRPSYDWLSPAETSQRLGLRLRDVYRLIDQGVLAGYRIAGEIKLLAHEVEEVRPSVAEPPGPPAGHAGGPAV